MTTKITLSNITDSVAANLIQVQSLAAVSANLLSIGQANAVTGGGGGTSYEQAATVNTWFGLPTGNTAQRTSSANGALRLNTETNYVEIFYGNTWFNLNYLGSVIGSGGSITTANGYRIHTFTESGTFSIQDAPIGGTVEYLIVGSGGGGGEVIAGGGGAGEVKNNNISIATGDSFTVVVSAGGAGGKDGSPSTYPAGTNGTATYITRAGETISSLGGGAGGGYNVAASTSGSVAHGGGQGAGGGAGRAAGIGFNSGGTSGNNNNSGAGGAGAGGVGSNSTSGNCGPGGTGVINPILGSTIGEYNSPDGSYYIAAGGGGGARIPSGGTAAPGGLGGGGDGVTGGNTTAPANTHGLNNTGSGGGGGGYTDSGTVNGAGGNGGSGVVIFRYRYQ